MTPYEAKQWAAQAWCTEKTSGKEMDVVLADEFAWILYQRVNETVRAYRVSQARKILKEEFEADEDFLRTYVDNIACILFDNGYEMQEPEFRNDLALEIMTALFIRE